MSSSRSTNSRQGMTSEEMINHSSEWTLAFDNALLNRLKEFSEIVDTASQEVNTECETLAKDINRLQSRVFNVTNEFLMLSNTQFVENRVQEFEETMESNSVPQSISNGKIKTKSEKEVELIAKMKEAIQIGVSTSVQQDKMQLSENQQQNSFPQLKLPHLIGTSKFFSSKYCGLTDDSKSTMPIQNTSTSNNNPRVSHILSSSSESLPCIPQPQHLDNIPHDSIPTDSRQPNMQNSYDNDNEHSNNSVKYPSTSADSTKESVTRNDWDSTKPSRAKATSSIVDDLNNAFRARLPPPPDDDSESDDDFKPSSNKKLFGDDDDDLFGENSLFASRQHEDIFGKPVVSDSIFSSQKTSNVKSLFNENADEYENISKKSESDDIAPSTAKQPSESNANVNAVIATKPKIPAGAVPMLGGLTSPQPPLLSKISSSAGRQEGSVKKGTEPSTEAIKSAAHSSQHAEKENKFTSQSSLKSELQQDSKHANSQGSSSDIHVPNNVNLQSKPKTKINSLFDENSDDDLFAPSNFSYGKKSNSSSLFDDNLKRNSSKAITKTAQLKPKGRLKQSIFDDSDSGDDLFSSASSSSSKSKEKSSISNVNQFFKPSLSIFTGRATESLFDDQEEDIFSSGQKVKVNVGSEGSNTSDKSKPSVSSATAESYLPSKDQPVAEKEKQILNDSKFNPLSTSKMDSEVGSSKPDEEETESLSAKNGDTDSGTKCGLDSSSQPPSNEQAINTSAFADSVISKPDAKVSALNKSNSVVDGVVKDKDSLQSNANAISSSVTRPQSLQIQPDKLPTCETTSVQQDRHLFSENSEKTMVHTVDGNSNFKSKHEEVSSSKVASPSPKEISERTPSTDAEKEIGKLKTSVKSIASSLKINPLALRPGSRPPKSSESTSQPSTPTSDLIVPDPIPVHEESKGLLTSVAKNRPKILQQRRPPSRKLRKSNYSADSIDGKEELSNNTNAGPEIKTPTQVNDLVFGVGDESEPTSPTVPADILSPSTEEEDIFSIGIESNQRSFSVEIASPSDDSILKPRESKIQSEVNQSFVPVESLTNNPPETKLTQSTLDPSQHYNDSVETSRPLSQNHRNPTRITLPSSKITQCSDSDSDDLFSNMSRKISHDSNSLKSKVKGDEDLFSEKPLAKQTLNRQIKSAPPVAQTNIQTESPQIDTTKDVQAGTENVNGQNRAAKTTKSLFSDSDDEDIFMPKSKIPSKPKVKEKVEEQVSSNVVPSLMPNKQKGLFDSDSDDDNLFGTKVKKPNVASSATTQNVITSSKPVSAIKTSRAAKLFSDSSDDDIFSSSKPATKAPARKTSVEKQTKQSSDDIRHHIFDDPLNNI